MDVWLNLASMPTASLTDVAVAAESCGYAGVAMGDHLVYPATVESRYPYSETGAMGWKPTTQWPDAWVAIAAMAAVTERLRFTTSVYVAPLREPVSLAKAVSTAAVIAGGRVACGFGAGWMREEFDLVGQDFATRGARLDEMIEVLRQLWTGAMVEHRGTHYSFDGVQMSPAPPEPIPVWIGGNTGPAIRRAVRHDGWIASYTDVAEAVALVGEVRAMREAEDRDGGPFHVAVTGPGLDAVACAALAGAGVDAVIVPLRMITSARTPEDTRAGMQGFLDDLGTAMSQSAPSGLPR
jgi:probable F420-dependent oxidoreductase